MDKSLIALLEKTQKLIENKQEDLALKLLEDDLKNPLYSLQDQDIIRTRIETLKKFITQTNIDTRWAKANKNELIKIFNTEGYEIGVLDKLFDKFGDSLTKTDYLKLQQVFLDDSVSNEMKITILNILKDYDVKHTFSYHNTVLNKTFDVDLTKDFSISHNETIFKIYDKLQALYFKETSKEQLAKQIIFAIYYYFFGDYKQIPYSYDDLFNNIVDYVDHAFNSITPAGDKFANWLNKILK